MSIYLKTAPTAEPVTLVEAKAQARVNHTADDTYITTLIGVVREMCEAVLGRSIMPQTWVKTLDCFPDAIRLYMPPVVSITSIKYTDIDGAEQTLGGAGYQLDNSNDFTIAYVLPAYGAAWPVTRADMNAVRVEYLAGWADEAAVPLAIKQWMLLHIAFYYDTRHVAGPKYEPITQLNTLIDRYRIMEK